MMTKIPRLSLTQPVTTQNAALLNLSDSQKYYFKTAFIAQRNKVDVLVVTVKNTGQPITRVDKGNFKKSPKA